MFKEENNWGKSINGVDLSRRNSLREVTDWSMLKWEIVYWAARPSFRNLLAGVFVPSGINDWICRSSILLISGQWQNLPASWNFPCRHLEDVISFCEALDTITALDFFCFWILRPKWVSLVHNFLCQGLFQIHLWLRILLTSLPQSLSRTYFFKGHLGFKLVLTFVFYQTGSFYRKIKTSIWHSGQ